ncbi:MAG TPA: BNR-4 repeat-containing protein [bacterium]|nr:BNR-4 repeat-containing protein [bacterium]
MKYSRSAMGLLLLMIMFSACGIAAERGVPVVLNDDAGWCWFQEERAVFAGGKLVAGSVAAGTKDAARKGNIEVSSFSPGDGEVERFVLHEGLELDDHDVPAFLELPDGRLLAVYSKHNIDRAIRYRVTERPGDISAWSAEKVFDRGIFSHAVTYSNLFRLEGENGRIYDFYRGDDFDPNVLISDDNGKKWRDAGRLIGGPGRPYVKYASDNRGEVHFICTDQHPRDFDNSIYHGCLRAGKIYDSFGNEVGRPGREPAEHSKLTVVFRGDKDNVAWPADFEYAADGRLYAVYSVQKDGAGMPKGFGGMDHRYRYAWFDGEAWHDNKVAYAGSKLYSGEDDYTGLICIHPGAVNTVYFSTNADPRTGAPLISRTDGHRHYEIFKGVTPDGGKTWEFTAVTSDSTLDQIRPNVPKGGPEGSALIWLRGRLKSYRDYDLEMVALIPAP